MPNVPLPEENDNERTHAGSIPPLPQSGEAQVSEGEQTVLEASHDPCGSAHCHECHAAAARAYVGIIGRSCRQIRQAAASGDAVMPPSFAVSASRPEPMEQPSPDHRSRVRG